MIYRFDKPTLSYKRITLRIVLLIFGIAIIGTLFSHLYVANHVNDVRFISEETKTVIVNEAMKKDTFSYEKLKEYIIDLNMRYPDILLGQAKQETGHFTSPIFKENNNLFGMKVATRRPTLNKGEESGHAYYNNWRESVLDYALYQAQYLSDLKTKDEYFAYIQANYSGDSTYVERVKKLMKEDPSIKSKDDGYLPN